MKTPEQMTVKELVAWVKTADIVLKNAHNALKTLRASSRDMANVDATAAKIREIIFVPEKPPIQ